MNWINISTDDVENALTPQELKALSAGNISVTATAIADVISMVREAIANNRANTLQAGVSVPQSLKRDVLAIVRMDLCERVALAENKSRADAAARAHDKLLRIAKGEWQILDDDNGIGDQPALIPAITSTPPAYGTTAQGLYPRP